MVIKVIEKQKIQMFFNQLNEMCHSGLQSPSLFSLQSNALEFQYQLCQIFLKKTGQQLHQRESQIILDSEQLVRSLTQKESSCSTDSGSESHTCSPSEEESAEQNGLRRVEAGAWRKVEAKLSLFIGEVQENCSALCLAFIKNLSNDYKKLLMKSWEIEARQGLMDRKQAHFQRQHEENLILKQKANSLTLKMETMQCQIECLKQKNQTVLDYANQRLQEMLGHQRLVEINSKVYREVRSFLEDKQKLLLMRTARAEGLESYLLTSLTSALPKDACSNCCEMLRRLRDSLLRFKRHLEDEAVEQQGLYQRYKKTLFCHKMASKLA